MFFIGGVSDDQTPRDRIEKEGYVHLKEYVRCAYDSVLRRFGAHEVVGTIGGRITFALAPSDKEGRIFFTANTYAHGQYLPALGWVRCDLTRRLTPHSRIDWPLRSRWRSPKSPGPQGTTWGYMKLACSKTLRTYNPTLGSQPEILHLLASDDHTLYLWKVSFAYVDDVAETRPIIWTAQSDDNGATWSEAAIAAIGQSPTIALLNKRGNALLAYASLMGGLNDMSNLFPPVIHGLGTYGDILGGRKKELVYIPVPRYACPIRVRHGSARLATWGMEETILPGWYAVELSLWRDSGGTLWLAFSRAVGPVQRKRHASQRLPYPPTQTPRGIRGAILKSYWPRWGKSPEKELPAHPRTQVMLSASRDEGKSWTKPVAVSDGKGSDWQPQVARVKDRVLVAWTRATAEEEVNVWAVALPVDKVLRSHHADRE